MKKNLTLILLVALMSISLCGCGNSALESALTKVEEYADTKDKMIIKSNGIDIFQLGKQIPLNTKHYVIEKDTKYVDSDSIPIYTIFKNGQKIFEIGLEYDYEAEQFTDKIGDVTIFSSDFKTAEGIGVGSSIQDFVNSYSSYTVWYTYVSDRYVLDTKQYGGMQFLLDGRDYLEKIVIDSDKMELKLSDFKPQAKIVGIRIYRRN